MFQRYFSLYITFEHNCKKNNIKYQTNCKKGIYFHLNIFKCQKNIKWDQKSNFLYLKISTAK